MSEMEKTQERIKTAYERTSKDLDDWQRPLPKWDALQSEMHEAFISVYFQGRRDAFQEMQEAATEGC
jgi:hypothetical protein